MYKDKLIIEYREFPSSNIGRIMHKGMGISSMCLYFSVLGKTRELDCMHELIHCWFHPNMNKLCIDNNFLKQSSIFEWQADEGAAVALMPENLFTKMFMALKGDIPGLSDYFFVAEKAIEYWIRNLGLTDINFNLFRVFGRKARYNCRICGHETLFYRSGALKEWYKEMAEKLTRKS